MPGLEKSSLVPNPHVHISLIHSLCNCLETHELIFFSSEEQQNLWILCWHLGLEILREMTSDAAAAAVLKASKEQV